MSRIVCLIGVWAVLGGLAAGRAGAAGPDDPAREGDSHYEQVELKDHTRYCGLIESEDDDWLTLICIQTPRGRQTHLVIRTFEQIEIESVARLDAGRRAALRKRIEAFRNRAAIEAIRTEAVRFKPSQGEGLAYRRYQGKWFTLDSTADEYYTRRMVVRAEQIFAAYRQILPPRCESSPPRLIVLASMDQYQSLLARLGLKTKIENPACFLEDRNLVVVGSDLARLAAVTSRVTAQNARLRDNLRDMESRLGERQRAVAQSLRQSGASSGEIGREVTMERDKFKRQIEKGRDELRQSDRQIERLFKRCADQTLARLYHEAFHAYLRDCVYPPNQYDVPPWFNEGLAVIFEGGQLEGNVLRVDAPNPLALKKLKADLAGASPLPTQDLLAAGAGQFLVIAGSRPAAVDRYYVHAWGLAYYLTFEKRLLGSPELEKYLRAGSARLPPAQRLQELTGMPLEQFEPAWRDYINSR